MSEYRVYARELTVMGDAGSCEGTREMEGDGISFVPFRDGESIGAGGCRNVRATGEGGGRGSTAAFFGGSDSGEDVLCTWTRASCEEDDPTLGVCKTGL